MLIDKRQPDRYDKAITFLTENPHLIYEAWCLEKFKDVPGGADPACLFQYAGTYSECSDIGCLTEIRLDSNRRAETPELTEAIRSDSRIPFTGASIKLQDLPVFAEWQRRLDDELNRS